ncbi:unnamed protein product [Ceutorhynchus assimilis]|uniref:Uncharacterized protein n=1 Tax=Ceutorhynchus assimilis TaxID=467358 RepID=A0A9P0DIC1_9CUCU|nr:unnamed protein product [Ceutorhynchus assimilis]
MLRHHEILEIYKLFCFLPTFLNHIGLKLYGQPFQFFLSLEICGNYRDNSFYFLELETYIQTSKSSSIKQNFRSLQNIISNSACAMMKSNWITSIFILVASWGVCVIGKKIPEFIHPCHRSDQHLFQCVNKSIEYLRPRLIIGIPELGIQALEPFKINKIVIFDGKDPSGSRGYLTDVEAKGAGMFQVTKIRVDNNKNIYRIGVEIPSLELEGMHNFDLNVFGLAIKSAGKYYSKSTHIHGQAILQGSLGQNNRLTFKSMALKLKTDNLDMKLESKFPENPILDQAITEIVHNNNAELRKLLAPITEKVMVDILLPICNNIVKDFNYDELFPI